MSPGNLAIVFGPTIMRPEVQDMMEMLTNSTKVDLCTYMILNREALFVDLKPLPPPGERMLGPPVDLGTIDSSTIRPSRRFVVIIGRCFPSAHVN